MNLGTENETLEFKKSISELKEGIISLSSMLNKSGYGILYFGVKNDGLVHISELSEKFVKNPMDVVSVGDIVKVRVIKIDLEKKKVSLSDSVTFTLPYTAEELERLVSF